MLSDYRILGYGDFVSEILKNLDEEEDLKETIKNMGWTYKRLGSLVSKIFEIYLKYIRSGRRLSIFSVPKGVFCYIEGNI